MKTILTSPTKKSVSIRVNPWPFTSLFCISCFVLCVSSTARAADPFPGSYSGPKLTLEISPAGNAYSGTIHLNNQSFPFKAQLANNQLSGTFTNNNHDYPFTATLAGDNLTFTSGANTFQLTRNPANPLDNATPPTPPNPLDAASSSPAPAASPDLPAGYSLAASTDIGKAWVAKKPNAASVPAALEAALHDLATFTGNKPIVKGAFEDTKDHQSGAASFTATLAGKPIVGLVTCKLADHEAKISITFCLASATAADWAKLNTSAAASAKPPAPAIKLTTFQFPDGTGSVGIADGWTLKSASVLDPLYVVGPNDQTLGTNGLWWIAVESPDSPRIRQAQEMQKKNEDTYRRLGRQAPPPGPSAFPIIAAFADPEHALPIVVPQWNAFKLAHNLEGIAIDPITSAKNVDSAQPGWKTQILRYGETKTVNGVAKHYQAQAQWSASPPGPAIPGSWALFPGPSMVAPDATFDKDCITMQAMSHSLTINWDNYTRVDWERFTARMKANQLAFDERMKEQRRQYVEQMKSYEKHNQEVAAAEVIKSRNADDWIEYAGGYRTVFDTKTGERSSVDLGNVTGVVNALNDNANDPGRYIQIPLRDERDPLIKP